MNAVTVQQENAAPLPDPTEKTMPDGWMDLAECFDDHVVYGKTLGRPYSQTLFYAWRKSFGKSFQRAFSESTTEFVEMRWYHDVRQYGNGEPVPDAASDFRPGIDDVAADRFFASSPSGFYGPQDRRGAPINFECVADMVAQPGFVCTTAMHKGGVMKAENWIAATSLIIDADGKDAPVLEEVLAWCQNKCSLVYTSRSHRRKSATDDRYRIVIPLSEPIGDMVDWYLMAETVNKLTGEVMDQNITNPCMRYAGQASHNWQRYCEVGWKGYYYFGVRVTQDNMNLPHRLNWRKVVELGMQRYGFTREQIIQKYSSNIDHWIENIRNPNPVYTRTQKPIATVEVGEGMVAEAEAIIQAEMEEDGHQGRNKEVYDTMVRMLAKYTSVEDVKAAVIATSVAQDWIAQDGVPQEEIDRKVMDAVRWHCDQLEKNLGSDVCRIHVSPSDLNPIHPVETIESEDLPSLDATYDRNIRAYEQVIMGRPFSPLMRSTLDLLVDTLSREGSKSIIDVPCGGGKSVAANVVAATDQDHHYMIVKPTLQACEDAVRAITLLGEPDTSITAAFAPDRCCQPREHTYTSSTGEVRQSQRSSVCKNCERCLGTIGTACPAGATLARKEEVEDARVRLVTHRRFRDMVVLGTVPKDRIVIIDECVDSYGTCFVSRNDVDTMSDMSSGFRDFFEKVYAGVDPRWGNRLYVPSMVALPTASNWREVYKEVDKIGISIADSTGESESIVNEDGTITNGERITVTGPWNLREVARELQMVLVDSAQCDDLFVYRGADDSLSLGRRVVDMNIDNTVVILDASALVTDIRWREFAIRHLDWPVSFGNVSLHVVKGNATKKCLRKAGKNQAPTPGDRVRELLLQYRKEGKQICVVGNKNLTSMRDDVGFLEDENENLVYLTRGNAIGSNEARDTSTVICMASVFRTVPDIVLRAMMRTGWGVEDREIWNGSNVRLRNGFDAPILDETFRRIYANEVYQHVMRSRARYHAGDEVLGIVVSPSSQYIHALSMMMPDIKVYEQSFVDMALFKRVEVLHEKVGHEAAGHMSMRELAKKLETKTSAAARREVWRMMRLVYFRHELG